jgi:hypothetical protein
MADTDTTLPIGIELPVRLVIGTGEGVIDAEVGTVTLDPGDTADKVIAEFLLKVAEEIIGQSEMAKGMIEAGLMTRVDVPADLDPNHWSQWAEEHQAGQDPRYMPGTTVVRGTPEALALLLGNAQDVNEACVPQPCPPFTDERLEVLPLVTSYSCGGDGCACQPTAS